MLLFEAPLTVLCSPQVAARLEGPEDLRPETLLRSYRAGEWIAWLEAAGVAPPALTGPVFDSAATMVEAAMAGHGIALAPVCMFERQLVEGRLVRPFAQEVNAGGYWLTRLKSKAPTPAMAAFEAWILAAAGQEGAS